MLAACLGNNNQRHQSKHSLTKFLWNEKKFGESQTDDVDAVDKNITLKYHETSHYQKLYI